jgi:hypothetical protein
MRMRRRMRWVYVWVVPAPFRNPSLFLTSKPTAPKDIKHIKSLKELYLLPSPLPPPNLTHIHPT